MRTGIVMSYNQIAGVGFIKDSNKQKIRFYNEDKTIVFKRFDVVQFDISFVKSSLQAVNVMPIRDKKGNIVSMTVNIN
ncbi:hypothetical protein [Pedobacter agri]|uniref:hypothetical protein n=1 Tax=Pedobacter agri TaxID=454586 RepID=UPI00292F883A|nr:hypothetical protein [Pedobacter agri]